MWRATTRAAKAPDFVATIVWLNGMPGARIHVGGAATAVSLVVEDGRITRIYSIRNPHKLDGWKSGGTAAVTALCSAWYPHDLAGRAL